MPSRLESPPAAEPAAPARSVVGNPWSGYVFTSNQGAVCPEMVLVGCACTTDAVSAGLAGPADLQQAIGSGLCSGANTGQWWGSVHRTKLVLSSTTRSGTVSDLLQHVSGSTCALAYQEV